MGRSSVHMNGNLLCAIDTETSGLKAGFNDLLQIAIIPLRPDLTPNTDIIPFHTKLQAKRPHNFDHESTKVHGTNLEDAMQYGMDPWTAVDLFDQWFNDLKLPFKKLIIPLGHNYTFDKDFIIDWMGGIIAYSTYFHGHVRDSMSAALFINDVADWQSENIQYPKVSLSYLCNCLGVQLLQKHDALADALASAECYRKLMSTPLVVNHGIAAEAKNALKDMKEHYKIVDKIAEEDAAKKPPLLKVNDKTANCTDLPKDQQLESNSQP